MKYLSIITIVCWLMIDTAFAADTNGKFSVKGAGRKSCEQFLTAREKASSDYLLYGGWVEGYISSYNQFQPNNYDITPWQTTELMLLLIGEHCRSYPQAKILSVTNGLIKAFFSIRLEKESDLVKLSFKKQDTYYYTEIIKRVKNRLNLVGVYNGDISSAEFSGKEIAAVIAFQKKAGLKTTGILDQNTLVTDSILACG